MSNFMFCLPNLEKLDKKGIFRVKIKKREIYKKVGFSFLKIY